MYKMSTTKESYCTYCFPLNESSFVLQDNATFWLEPATTTLLLCRQLHSFLLRLCCFLVTVCTNFFVVSLAIGLVNFCEVTLYFTYGNSTTIPPSREKNYGDEQGRHTHQRRTGHGSPPPFNPIVSVTSFLPHKQCLMRHRQRLCGNTHH